jgi:hypothetical protein
MTDYDGEPDEHRFQRVDRDAQERRLAERERERKRDLERRDDAAT